MAKPGTPLDIWSYFTGAQRTVSEVQGAGLEEANRKPQNIHRRDEWRGVGAERGGGEGQKNHTSHGITQSEAGELGWEEYSDFISHGTSFCLFGKILHL